MRWQSYNNTGHNEHIATVEAGNQVVVGNINPATAEYIATACNIYESLISNYLAIADELARREGLELLSPPGNDTADILAPPQPLECR